MATVNKLISHVFNIEFLIENENSYYKLLEFHWKGTESKTTED